MKQALPSLSASSNSLSLVVGFQLPSVTFTIMGNTSAQADMHILLWRFLAFWPSVLQNCQATGSNAQEVFGSTPFAPESSWMGGWAVLGHLDSLQGGWVNENLWAFWYKAAYRLRVHMVWVSAVNSPAVPPIAAAPKPALWSHEGGVG